ncbi:MAG TPA: hypothetical protein VGD80_13665, partial [Kofleriaceae bacterium]
MRSIPCCVLLVFASGCGLGVSETTSPGAICGGGSGSGTGAPCPDAGLPGDGSGSEPPIRGDFPDPNGPPPPLETTCDCIDTDGDGLCDDYDPCPGTGSGSGSAGSAACDAGGPPGSGPSGSPLQRASFATPGGPPITNADATISGWGCEYSRPTCTANAEPACRAIQDCEWVAGSCRAKACVASWQRLCQDFIARRAAGDRFAYRGNSTWSSDLFTTGPAPVP